MDQLKELPAESKLIPGFVNYYCTPKGDVISTAWGKIILLKPKNEKGYLRVNLCVGGICKLHTIHRIVALTFIGQSDLYVNHKDGIKSNNDITNLEYVTPRENAAHWSLNRKRVYNTKPNVHWDKKHNKWIVAIHVGSFNTKEEALAASVYTQKKLGFYNKYTE